jgi:hypothetical protein
MKPSRKLNRGSFMSRVSGGSRSGGGLKEPGGHGKNAVESDHDLGQPPVEAGGADPDNQPR